MAFDVYILERSGAKGFRRPLKPLRGGFVTDVFSFELDEAPPEWSGPLVLRVYPSWAQPSDVRREWLAQDAVDIAPRVVACEPDAEPAFMIMERLVGRPQMVIAFP